MNSLNNNNHECKRSILDEFLVQKRNHIWMFADHLKQSDWSQDEWPHSSSARVSSPEIKMVEPSRDRESWSKSISFSCLTYTNSHFNSKFWFIIHHFYYLKMGKSKRKRRSQKKRSIKKRLFNQGLSYRCNFSFKSSFSRMSSSFFSRISINSLLIDSISAESGPVAPM